MTDTPIADMVEQMLSGGIPPETIVLAVRAAELAVQQTTRASLPVDAAAAKRRAWDRDRKRRAKSGIPPETENPSLIELSSSRETIKVEKEVSDTRVRNSGGIPPEKPKKRKKGPLPDEWRPPQRAYNLAVSLGLIVGPIEAQFRDYLAATGRQYLDYDAGFCNFVRNAKKFGAPNGNAEQGNIAQGFDSLIDRIRSFDRAPTVRGGEGEADVRLLPEG